MGSVYHDRFDDSRTSVSSVRRDGGGYTTRTRYIVKEDDNRSSIGRDRRFAPERTVEETRIVRREVEEPAREVRREETRFTERELPLRRDDDARSHFAYDNRRDEPPTAARELVIRHTTTGDESRREDAASVVRYDDRPRGDVRVTETRYRDDYELVSPTRGIDDRDRDLQRYTRTSEYFSPPQPQTIVIRQEPIIIRERIRDDDYQIVRKSDLEDERTVVRREKPRGEEDFFYEKKVRERIDEPRRDEDDYYERRSRRRSVSPHDSVSQRGRDYSSDDSMVYVRKEVREDSREASPDRRKNLAAGVVAGIGAAELLRNHKKREGRETSHGIGRLGRDVGAGALGAIAAEGISRARSAHRSKSRRRSRERRSRSRSRNRRSRSRSRSSSRSKLKTLGAVGLGAAALAAAATIASKRLGNKNKDEPPRRSRSRHRREETLSELENDSTADDARNPKHRNKRIAEAGAAGAVVAGLIERARSKSRPRSQSKVRQALPVVAAGLGSAALAGLYEKNKAKKEAEVIQKEERRARSRSRSRARSDAYSDIPRDAAISDPGLIEYGNGPMHGNNYGPGYYGRPAPVDNYYETSNAVVPAAAAGAGGYAAQRETRSRSRSLSRERRSRRSSRSSSASPGRRKHSRRRSRDADKYGAAAAAGTLGASEYERRKQEKRERRERRRQQEEAAAYGARDPYEDRYNAGAPYASTPDPYASQQGFYPQTSQFPPPPGSMPTQYDPQTGVAPPPSSVPYPGQTYPPPPAGPPPTNPNYDAYASGANPYAPRGPENVSAAPNLAFGNSFPSATPNDQHHAQDGLNGDAPAHPPPVINIQPPSTTLPSSQPALVRDPVPVPPVVYPPPPEDRPHDQIPPLARSQSQPPPSSPRKSVQFSEKPEVSTFSDALPRDSETSSPEHHQTRHKHSHSHGYEAGDDTDSTVEDLRRRHQNSSSRPREAVDAVDGTERRRHRRRRSHDPSSSRGETRSRETPVERVTSPADSEATVDLPARFDEKGRKKAEAGDDPLADRFDDILAGKGAAGKALGNFFEGLFGPDGRKRGSR